ncbi:MAG: prenyltransferase/squalene oxidase repeat-containing protein, partial [Planctomycetota bacterium]|nr:prenyltransferase/squalene oxidase repeat-containing protein [Planctomycetota bacterium]
MQPNYNSGQEEVEVQEGSLAEKALAQKFDFNLWLQEQLHNAPWWGISLAFHIFLILILASIQGTIDTRVEVEVVVAMNEDKEKEIEKVEEEIKDEIEEEVTETTEVSEEIVETDVVAEFDTDSPLTGAGVYDAIGIGGGLGGGRRGGRGRGGKKSEDAVLAGLIWLAKHQNPDGSWGAKAFQNQCRVTKCAGPGHDEFNIGLTGLSMLAFTGAGYTPSSKDTYEGIRFGDVVRKASAYLISIQLSDGTFGGVKDGKFLYNQTLAAYALTDLYGLIMDSPAGIAYRKPVEIAIRYLIEVQNPTKAWRYQPKDGQNDTSVTGWVVMALKTAEYAKIPVPPEAFAGIKSFYDDVTDQSYGKVGYTSLGSYAFLVTEDPRNTVAQPSLTAIGVMVRIFIDRKTTDPLVKLGVQQVLASLPTWDTTRRGVIDYYYWFYASYCLNQYDGPDGPSWKQWNEKMKDVLLKSQKTKVDGCANGSWDPLDRWSEEGSRVYCTAINVLTLEVYYRLGIAKLSK